MVSDFFFEFLTGSLYVVLQSSISHHGVGFSPLLAVFYLLNPGQCEPKIEAQQKQPTRTRTMAISKLVSCWRCKTTPVLPEKFAVQLRCILFLGGSFWKAHPCRLPGIPSFFHPSWKFFGRCHLNKTWLYIKFLISIFWGLSTLGYLHIHQISKLMCIPLCVSNQTKENRKNNNQKSPPWVLLTWNPMSLVVIGKDLLLQAKQRTNEFQIYISIHLSSVFFLYFTMPPHPTTPTTQTTPGWPKLDDFQRKQKRPTEPSKRVELGWGFTWRVTLWEVD